MILVGAGGKGESVGLAGFLLSLLPRLAALAAARGAEPPAAQYRGHVTRLRRASTRRGTANGTAAGISTMGRRWDRLRTPSAASTRSRSHGPLFRAPAIVNVLARRWSRPIPIWYAARTGWCCC